MGVTRRSAAGLVVALALLLAACGGPKPGGDGGPAAAPAKSGGQKVLNLYIWADYLAPDTIPNFEKQTGIKVNVAFYDSNEQLETKLLAGQSGYDVVVPSASFFERQIKAGVYLPLDRSRLPNIGNLDPSLMARVAANDPGNAHGVIYMWGTIGLGINEKMVKALAPDAPTDSWRLVFDPAWAAKVAKCGINFLDSPAEMMRVVYTYLGKDLNSADPADLAAAEKVLAGIRPYIRNISTADYIEALANGDLCVAVGYNGDLLQSRDRAREAGKGIEIRYSTPVEGTVLWFDSLAIPKDAHPDSAYAFINYILTPQVAAEISNFKRFANANAASQPFLQPDVKSDPGIYPTPQIMARLKVQTADSPEQARAQTRAWQKFKTGQ
jgi:putrescine transport system substrate-binding protein